MTENWAKVMAYCMTAPIHYMNQCWLIIEDVLWHSHENNFTRNTHELHPLHVFGNYTFTITTASPSGQWVKLPHDDVINWKHFPRYWPFVMGIHRSPVNSPHKGQWRGVLMFSLIFAWIDDWVNNREAGDLRRHCAHYDVAVAKFVVCKTRKS